MQSNSGASACGMTAAGVRKDGVALVVDLVGRYPEMDGFTLAWLEGGGQVAGGHLVGATAPMSPAKFARVISLQKRVLDAEKLGKIEVSKKRAVIRKRDDGQLIKAKAYRLPGSVSVGVSMSRPAVVEVAESKPLVPKKKVDVNALMADMYAVVSD